MSRVSFSLIIVAALLVSTTIADDVIPADPPARWWRGNLHTHSLWSDGNDFPEMIAEWYRTHDYNFLALSDHNVLSEGQRWMAISAIIERGVEGVVDKYERRFGGGWIERRGEGESEQIRLKPLNEFRALVESRGTFIMIQGEEISDSAEEVPVHMNASNLMQVIPPVGGETVGQAISNNLRAVEQQADRVGREILVHLNHPNFGEAITAEVLAFVTAERFFEVYNGHPDVQHLGNENLPGVERIWDIANTIRIANLSAPPLMGLATDDSHEYHGRPGSRPGRGWVMVRSKYLTPEHIVRAIKAGDFYASSGVALETIEQSEKTLSLRITAQEGVSYTTRFIGTRRANAPTMEMIAAGNAAPQAPRIQYSENLGAVLATVEGTSPEYHLTGDELYVRAVVTSDRPHPDPSFENQFEQAWTQPVGWEKHLEE